MATGWWAEYFAFLAATLPMPESSLAATTGTNVMFSPTLPLPKVDLSLSVPIVSSLSAQLPEPLVSLAVNETETSLITANIPLLLAAMTGTVAQTTATLAAMLGLPVAALAATEKETATLAATLRLLTAALTVNQASPPTYDSAQSSGPNTYGASNTLTHTTIAASTTLYAFFTAVPYPIVGATCDGVAMTQAGTISGGELTCWKATVAAGQHSIVGSTAGTGNPSGIIGFSIAYKNVTTTSAAQTLTGTTTAASQAVSLGSGTIILHAFGAYNGSASGASFTGPTGGTTRFNNADGNRSGLCVSDATATTTFAATGTPSYYNGWGALAFILS